MKRKIRISETIVRSIEIIVDVAEDVSDEDIQESVENFLFEDDTGIPLADWYEECENGLEFDFDIKDACVDFKNFYLNEQGCLVRGEKKS